MTETVVIPSTMPEIITAIAAVITAMGLPVVAYFTYLGLKIGKKNLQDTGEVHKIVNSANEALVAEAKAQSQRIETLMATLGQAGVAVPPKPTASDE